MKKKKKIRVIKKNSVKPTKLPVIITEEITKEESDNEMVSTVSDWINEFQKKRAEEKREALKNF